MSKGEQGCHRCVGKHDAQKCWHKKTKCHGCAKVGHLRHMCKNNPRMETKVVGSEGLEEVQDTEEDTHELGIHYIKKGQPASEIHTINWSTPKYVVEVVVGTEPVQMELDTGAMVSVAVA